MKIEKLNVLLNESLSDDALNPGVGLGSPTAVDCRMYIEEALDALNDKKYRNMARDQLEHYAQTILKSKQKFEDFDNYWAERYPAMINLLDSQLDKIPSDIIAGLTSMEEGMSDRIRKNDLEGGDGNYWASEGDVDIDIQDREKHTHEFGTTTNRWGKKFIGDPLNKHPKVSTNTWGRIWKNGKFDRSFEGPKYQVRAQMAKYLDEDVNEQIIIGFGADGSRKYYNNESKEWMNTPDEATIFSSGDEARDVWFGLDKKPFKRVFVACNDGNV